MLDTKSEILLETGTNELEVLEFTIDGKRVFDAADQRSQQVLESACFQ